MKIIVVIKWSLMLAVLVSGVALSQPTITSVVPGSGSGTSQTFAVTANGGPNSINLLYFLVNDSLSGANACYVQFDNRPSSGYIYLANDDGSGWLGPITPNSSDNPLTNRQCTVTAQSSFSRNGNSLTVNLPLTFNNNPFTGLMGLWVYAADSQWLNSGFPQEGTWTVPPQGTPSVVSATPVSGYGLSQTFALTVSDPSGPRGIEVAYLMVNSSLVASQACYVEFNRQYNTFRLMNDAGSAWSGSITLGTSGTLPNSQCTVSGTGASWSSNGNQVTVQIPLVFSASFGGVKNTYGYAYDTIWQGSGWLTTGSWTVPMPPLTLPMNLKGVQYFPRGHAWWNMLYDWYTLDCSTTTLPSACQSGKYVYQIVQSDLQMLKANGINFIHLYLWDQDIVGSGTSGPGFMGWDDGGPQNSPQNQWSALQSFVSIAQANGILLNLEFAVSRPYNEVQQQHYDPTSTGQNYGNWVNQFISAVQSAQNVLIWGLDYGIPGPSGPPWSTFWQAAYLPILSQVQNHPYSSGRPLLMVSSNFFAVWPQSPNQGDVQPILSPGYQWTWQNAHQTPAFWSQVGITPDLYSFEMYNASAADLEAALNSVSSAIPFSKMVVTEVATGSSMENYPLGNGLAVAIDAQTPSTTAVGQAQWLTDTLCVFYRHNIPAFGWYGVYDSASWWNLHFNNDILTAARDGYWGLISEFGSNKPAWTAMLNYPGNCPASYLPPAPVIALYADATYYTQGDFGTIAFTGSDVTSLSLNETPVQPPDYRSGVFSCETSDKICSGPPPNGSCPAALVGSCAALYVSMANTTSQITVSGTNTDVNGSSSGYQTSGSASIGVTVGLTPIITGVVDYNNNQSCNLSQSPACTITASQTDTLEILGLGYSLSGGNAVELIGTGGTWWLYETDGYYFWDASRTQINAQIGCYVQPGSWTFSVKNPNSGNPSPSYSINIVSSSNCH